MLLGDSLPSTMVAGLTSVDIGAGRLVLTGCGRGMLPRWWPGLAGRGLDLVLVLAADLDGARWALASHSFPGMA